MKFFDFSRLILLYAAILISVSCKDNLSSDADKAQPDEDFTFSLSVDKLSLETADVRVRHDGASDLKWVFVQTEDFETSADDLIAEAVEKELAFADQLHAYQGNNRSLRLSGLSPKTYYRVVVKAVDDYGTPVGKPSSLDFRTMRDLDMFEENTNWDVEYADRTEGILPGSSEIIEYDNFNCMSSDDEPYIVAVIKKADYNAFQKDPDHKLKVRTFFESVLSFTGVSDGDWDGILEKGDCIWQEQRLRHGDWYVFMIGVDEEGDLTGLYRQVECIIDEEDPTDDFNKWIGTWDVKAYDDITLYNFELTFLSAEANLWYYSIGWEPNNIYMIDPATLPVEVFFEKSTGKAYLVSQYVTTAYDAAGAQMDFYFYGSFPYGGANTFLPEENIKIAELAFTDASCTEARVTGLKFSTTQAGTMLDFQYTSPIYYMVSGGIGGAISLSHPDFPFTMKKVASN